MLAFKGEQELAPCSTRVSKYQNVASRIRFKAPINAGKCRYKYRLDYRYIPTRQGDPRLVQNLSARLPPLAKPEPPETGTSETHSCCPAQAGGCPVASS